LTCNLCNKQRKSRNRKRFSLKCNTEADGLHYYHKDICEIFQAAKLQDALQKIDRMSFLCADSPAIRAATAEFVGISQKLTRKKQCIALEKKPRKKCAAEHIESGTPTWYDTNDTFFYIER